MNPETLLYRQIHPSWVNDKGVTSQSFTPMPKDHSKLSVDHGDLVTAEDAYKAHVSLGLKSAGVLAVSVAEVTEHELDPVHDQDGRLSHCHISFDGFKLQDQKTKAKILRDLALKRGWKLQS